MDEEEVGRHHHRHSGCPQEEAHPTGRMLLAHMELASFLSSYGPEPPSEELLREILALPPSDRAELAEILGARALEIEKR